jgi:Fungal chitosanase of glycosyl hydrolase group 75
MIAGVSIYEFIAPVLRLQWDAGMTIDCDGSGGNPDDDPYYQDDTSLHYNGKALNAYEVPFIVVPPFVISCVKPVVMGCMAVVINLGKGLVAQAVVGDCGPQKKIGEASCKCAENVGLDGDPNHGGTEEKIVRYMIWPGIPAIVDGITYKLQSSA